MELCDFIVPGTGIVDSIGIGPLKISVAPRVYRKVAGLTQQSQISSMHHAGVGNCDTTMKATLRMLRAFVDKNGPANATGHSQGAFQLARIFVEEPDLFNEVILLDGPLNGSEVARAGAHIAAGFGGMTPQSKSVRDLQARLAETTVEQRRRLHLYAASTGVFVLPHVSALCNLEGIDNVWVGKGHPLDLRSYTRFIKSPKLNGHIALIRNKLVLADVRQIFELSGYANVVRLIPQQSSIGPVSIPASS